MKETAVSVAAAIIRVTGRRMRVMVASGYLATVQVLFFGLYWS